MVKKLREFGFEKIGEIKLIDGKFQKFQNIKDRKEQVLFLIASNSQIKYIGRTTQNLYKGFNQVISNQKSRDTYMRVMQEMKKCIKDNTKIYLYSKFMYEKFTGKELDEKKLFYIDETKPEWNIKNSC